MSITDTTTTTATATSNEWFPHAQRISAAWQKGVESVLETGRLLIEAKRDLQYGTFEAMVERQLPFTSSTAQRLMAIARHPALSDPAHVQHLPPSWGTLYELTKLPDALLAAKLADGTINSEIERKEVIEIAAEGKPKRPGADVAAMCKSVDARHAARREARQRERRDESPDAEAQADNKSPEAEPEIAALAEKLRGWRRRDKVRVVNTLIERIGITRGELFFKGSRS